MKKNAIRILSLLLVIMTLVGVISLPVSAYSYPMNYTITYKTKDGKTLGTNSGQVDAEATVREALRVTSPSYDGYVLSDSNDSVVTGKMISWRFPASNYVRHGSGSYTVYYEKACKMVVHYVYGASRRTMATTAQPSTQATKQQPDMSSIPQVSTKNIRIARIAIRQSVR